MKNCLTSLFKSSIFRYVQRLVMVCMLLSISVAAAANKYKSEMTVKVASNSTGYGLVWVTKTQNDPGASNSSNYDVEKKVSQEDQIEGGNHEHKYYLHTWANEGYYHIGWSEGQAGTSILSNSGKGGFEQTLVGNKDNTTKGTRYAVFKHYRYGYSDGRTAQIAEGAAFGKISLDKSNWSTTSLTATSNGETKTLRQQGDATENEGDVIELTYYAGPNDANCFFLGWYIKDVNGNLVKASSDDTYLNTTYTHKFYPASENSGEPSTVPTLYAKFGKKAVYKDEAVAQVVLTDADGKYQEMTGDMANMLALVGAVYVNPNAEVTPTLRDYSTPTYTSGDGNIKAISDEAAIGNYYYTYHAYAQEGYLFVGWATELTGDDGKVKIENENTKYTYTHFTNSQDDNKPGVPKTLYAVFKQNTYYYYKGAVAGFTENGEKGKVTVTSSYYDKETATMKNYSAVTTDALIDDSENTYNQAINVKTYTFTYKAEDMDPDGQDLTTFKGWSRSPRGGNIISTIPEYSETYTTYATLEENPVPTAPLYAVFQSYWFKNPTASAVGAGQVFASFEEELPSNVEWNTVIPASNELNQVAANDENHPYSVWYHAKPNFGAYFVGWSYVNDAKQEIPNERKRNPYKVDYAVTATDDTAPFVSARLYAVFESVIKIIQQDRMIYYTDDNGIENVNDANVIINFNESDQITAQLVGANQELFMLSDKSNVLHGNSLTLDASTGLSHLVLKYIGNDPQGDIGKTATIRLSSNYTENGQSGTASIDVLITIEEKPYVSFLPTDGKGAYTIKHTDGRGVDFVMPSNATDNITVSIAQENMATFELNLTEDAENDGLTFAGWQVVVDDVATYFSYEKKCTHTFKESAFVRPMFLADDRAVFTIINDVHNNKYYDLQLALDDAHKKYQEDPNKQQQVVVFSNEGKVEGTLYQGNYIVRAGVTLLIPGVGPDPIKVLKRDKKAEIDDPFLMKNEGDLSDGKNKYVYRTKRMETISEGKTGEVVLFLDDYTDVDDATTTSYNAPYSTCYRKLLVQDNTSITVLDGGIIQLYSVLCRKGVYYEASPYRYGQIDLGEKCRIDVQDGASLQVFGYITGAHSSRVIANSGAEVHEVFQYSDPRGGAGVAHLFLTRDYYKVFPYSQYYVQNVEVPLEIKAGATEYVTITADVMKAFVLMTPFVIPKTTDADAVGLFQLGDHSSFVKYYDPLTDRLKIIIEGSSVDAIAKFGSVKVEMGDLSGIVAGQAGLDGLGDVLKVIMNELGDVKLNSNDYVLPLNHNMDIFMENIDVELSSDFAFLAGSTLTIDENSTMRLLSGSHVYIYDANENLLPKDLRTHPTSGVAVADYAQYSGYFSSTSDPLKPISSTPNNSHLLNGNAKRQAKDVKDSKWVVNGKIEVQSGAGLYTTAGKAQIVSTQKGQVSFATSLGNTNTYQARYIKGGAANLVNTGISDILSGNVIKKEGVHNRISYSVTSAQLLNADGGYVETSANSFYYNPEKGKWLNTPSAEHNPLQGAQIRVTRPDASVTCKITSKLQNVSSATIATNNGQNSTAEISVDAVGTHISFAYTPINKAGEYEGLVNMDNGANYQRIVITEDYTPQFTAKSQFNTLAYLGYSYEANADIMPEANNVAGIISGNYASIWSYEITGTHADEFSLVWGEGANKLSDAKIVFRPKTVGNKSALLSLTCTYTDAAEVAHTTTVAVPLSAVAATHATNTLAFAPGVEQIFISSSAQDLFAGMNSHMPITITPSTNDVVTITSEVVNGNTIYKIAPKAKGSVTITATQEADLENGIAAASITKTIHVTEDIVWNWEHLYFGSINTNPITTIYDNWSIDIAEDSYHVILNPTLVDDDVPGVVAKIAPWTEGETTIKFIVTYYIGETAHTKVFESEVYRDPRKLSISVNEDRLYNAITVATSATVEYMAGYVGLISEEKQPAQWTFQFDGIPDELSFTATGLNNWQIEESANGTNWTIAYTWAKIAAGTPFEMSLQPATRYVRISYGTEHAENVNGQLLRAGTLSNITVSELKSVKADVSKLYMPMVAPNESTSKNVVFTYVGQDGYNLSTTGDALNANPNQLSGTTEEPYYQVQRVAVTSTATKEQLGSLNVNGTETKIPVQIFSAPQAIPIQLASDHKERYYYVATQSYQTTWDENNLTVVMKNAVADASPYVVFHFAESPTPGLVSFNYSQMADGTTWVVQESADATSWSDLTSNDDPSKNLVMRTFNNPETSRYLKITLMSDYAEIVELSNVAILPTANVVVNPTSMTIFDDKAEKLGVTANNLCDVTFTISDGFQLVDDKGTALDATALTERFVKQGQGSMPADIYVKFLGTKNSQALTVTEGQITITTTKDAQCVKQEEPVVLATVDLLGIKRTLAAGATGIYTGVKTTADVEGEIKYTINGFKAEDGAEYREVNVEHAFADGTALFDYVIIYGATTTTDESTTITAPTSTSGSNAKTPCYIYKNKGGQYQLEDISYVAENANSHVKTWKGALSISDCEVGKVDNAPETLSVYITGFCPYASTGYSKADEGVWHFRGDAGDNIHIYLENCYIYSRYKTKRGNSFSRNNGETFSDKVVRGSGAVLLFENNTQVDADTTTMKVTIHTRETNLLKSHYGCLFESIVGRAFQVSAPVQVYMQSINHVANSHTVLNFTDEWPTAADGVTTERTNGFLSLQKQVNNAPSIDMGNANTVVNFRGGQVELQNACNSSDNYESTLAISFRSGIMGPASFRFRLAYGIGTDDVGGRVNFYDGTTTVRRMEVPERYRQYYLMDGENEELSTTSCLRTPQRTFIYGGSHCMMRACSAPTSKGGAPTDGTIEWHNETVDGSKKSVEYITGNPLGLYQYTNSEDEGWTDNGTYGLVTPTNFPSGLEKDGTELKDVHLGYPDRKYGVESITPTNSVLNLWIPGGFKRGDKEVGKQPEVEQMISYWKACMTKIEAKYGVYEGSVGGPTSIQTDAAGNQIEQVQNLLYCEIDQNISDEIRSADYSAPVLNPAPVENVEEKYMSIAPTTVGEEYRNNIMNTTSFKVENKVYYIVPAQADVWMAFTAPFNVEKLWIMETRTENDLLEDAKMLQIKDPTLNDRAAMLKAQARHNADFASFFGVAMALESKKPFDDIYQDYMGWARLQDGGTTQRGKQQLVHFDGTNWSTADYYLYENGGDVSYNLEDLKINVNWQTIPTTRDVLMQKGTTYSLFFPYCMGCWVDGEERDFWDYWTGKFLIFESTAGDANGHLVDGTESQVWQNITSGNAMYIVGNTALSEVQIPYNESIYPYLSATHDIAMFKPMDAENLVEVLKPTQAFLYANITAPAGQKVTGIKRTGEIIYDDDNNGNQNGTSGHIPTVGGGNDLFITSIEGGINVAVAAPQYVRVLSSTGSVIYSGMIQTALDIPLPSLGMYVVSGEKEVQKVMY